MEELREIKKSIKELKDKLDGKTANKHAKSEKTHRVVITILFILMGVILVVFYMGFTNYFENRESYQLESSLVSETKNQVGNGEKFWHSTAIGDKQGLGLIKTQCSEESLFEMVFEDKNKCQGMDILFFDKTNQEWVLNERRALEEKWLQE